MFILTRSDELALYTMTELCERYGISRKTGYKWLDRFDEGGRQALGDPASRRINVPTASPMKRHT